MREIIIILFGGFLILLNSCTFHKPIATNPEDARIDSLLVYYHDSVAVIPEKILQIIGEQRESVSDSVNSYNLLQFISRCFFFSNQLDTAFLLNDAVLDFCKKQSPSNSRLLQLTANAYNSRGLFLQDVNQWDSAIICMRTASDILLQTNIFQPFSVIDIYINLADCNQHQGDYGWAGFYYRRALFMADSLNVLDKIGYPIYSGLARLYQELENFPLSDSYFQMAESYWDKGTPYEKYYFANSRGNYYYVTKDYGKALVWFNRAHEIVSTFPQPLYKGIVEGNLGEIYLLKEQPDSARYYLDRAASFIGETALKQPGIKFYMDGLYASLAFQENDLQEASRRLIQPYDTLHTDLQYQYYHNKRLEELYSRRKDFEKAYYYKDKAEVCDDSLRSQKVRNSITEIDFRYRQDTTLLKKDIRIAYAENKAEKWEFLACIAALVFVITLLVVACFYIYQRRKRELYYKDQLAIVTGLRMAIVRNRIAPHYIFNVLNSVMPAFRRYDELAEPVRLLIEVLRGDLQSSEQLAISLEKEITLVRNYLQLHQINHPKQIAIDWLITPGTPMDILIPSMSIQIPVENAVKYAFTPDCADTRICISICFVDDYLHILIEDNGIGYNPGIISSIDARSTGNGLKILYRTTELLNTRNFRKMHFSIENRQSSSEKEHGTRVTLIIPSNYNFIL